MQLTKEEINAIMEALSGDANYERTFEKLVTLISDDSLQQTMKKTAYGHPAGAPVVVSKNLTALGVLQQELSTLAAGKMVEVLERDIPLLLMKQATYAVTGAIHEKAAKLACVDKYLYFATAGLDGGTPYAR